MNSRAPAAGGELPSRRAIALAVLVAALGYFVDIFDLVLFGVVRNASLTDLGVAAAELQSRGEFLIKAQFTGLLLGGIAFGILGDRRGRLSVLFGSILLYSIANIANGLVHSLPAYACWRFLAGFGLAGELGAGITLVSELMHKDRRGVGTTIVAAVGLLGATAAAMIGDHLTWRAAYFVGGGLGLALLLLRFGVAESGMFRGLESSGVRRGDFLCLFRSWSRLRQYLGVIVVGLPIWYVVGLLVFFAPELARALGMEDPPSAADAIFWCYAGLSVGDLSSGLWSQFLRSRRKAVLTYLLLTVAAIHAYFLVGTASPAAFKACCFLLGVGTGYWAVFVTMAAEQFGTNLRATVATTAPNFVRGTVPLMVIVYEALRGRLGPVPGILTVGAVVLALAFVALALLRETYGRDLDFVESDA